MKKKIVKDKVPICLSCGGLVLPNLGTSATGFFGYECSTCEMKYIFPPPTNQEHWNRTREIFSRALENEGNEKNEISMNLSEIIKDSYE